MYHKTAKIVCDVFNIIFVYLCEYILPQTITVQNTMWQQNIYVIYKYDVFINYYKTTKMKQYKMHSTKSIFKNVHLY